MGGIDRGRFLPPHNSNDLLLLQSASVILYALIATLLGLVRRVFGRTFSFVAILRSAVAGAGLPVAVLLGCVPFVPGVLGLLSAETMKLYLMIAGVLLTLLSLYGLVK